MMKVILLQLLLLLLRSFKVNAGCTDTKVTWKYEWKYVDYDWDSEDQKKQAISNGDYNPKVNVLIDVEEAPNGKVFVTTVRHKGVPASLMTITDKKGEGGPLLRPYPDWSWTKKDGITSVHRIAIDSCNRLWVLDSGKIDDKFVVPARLLAFDLFTDKLLYNVEIPNEVAYNKNGNGSLITPIVQLLGDCNCMRVYMADSEGYGLVIWNTTDVWRIESDSFKPESDAVQVRISGNDIRMEYGIFGMSIYQPRGRTLRREGDQKLYYRAFSSYHINSISTVLLNKKYGGNSSPYYEQSKSKISSRSAPMAFISGTSTLIFGAVERNAIASWDCETKFEDKNLKCLAHDEEKIQFTSGLKFYPYEGQTRGKVVMLNNRHQVDNHGLNRNLSEVNFNIGEFEIEYVP